MGGSDQTVVEVISRHALSHLLVEERHERRGLDLRGRGREDDALAFLDRHLEIARHIQVLVGGIAALLLLRILDAAIPVGTEDKLVLLGELHKEVGIASIHTGLDAVVHLTVLTTGCRILVGELTHGTEGQERTEAQGGGRMGLDQGIADKDAVLVVLEDHLFLQHDTSDTIGRRRHDGGIEFADVFMAVRTEDVALILV